MAAIGTIIILVIVGLAILGAAVGIMLWAMRIGVANYEPPEDE